MVNRSVPVAFSLECINRSYHSVSPIVHVVSNCLCTSQTPETLYALVHYPPPPALYLSLAHIKILAIAMVVQAQDYLLTCCQ